MQQGSTATSARPGVGDGAGEIHPAPRRIVQTPSRKNRRRISTAYRITEADRLGDGGAAEISRNLKAIQTLRMLDAEERPATLRGENPRSSIRRLGRDAQVFGDGQPQGWRKNASNQMKSPMTSIVRPCHHAQRSLHIADRHRCDVSRLGTVRFCGRPRARTRDLGIRPLRGPDAGGHASAFD